VNFNWWHQRHLFVKLNLYRTLPTQVQDEGPAGKPGTYAPEAAEAGRDYVYDEQGDDGTV
jgi:hypothetical protein